ncbi:MAG: cyclic nucleotide-binding domain-containing protein [Dehalococcoidia bacterium]|nr:MAG: cyclic nucleotide-binding domain-containing protein [Dehalococcoidia bacterium]
MVDIQVLKEFNIFKDLEDSELERISELCNEKTLEEGSVCFTQNWRANDLHLCRTGQVNLVVKLFEPWSREVIIYKTGAGEVFGWSALVEPYIYTSSAKCIEETDEIYIKGSDLQQLFDQYPRIGYIIMRNLSAIISSRLTETRQKLSKEYARATHHDYEW